MSTTRKIMICGGAGFIGSYLVDRFMAEGHEVDVVDDLSELEVVEKLNVVDGLLAQFVALLIAKKILVRVG